MTELQSTTPTDIIGNDIFDLKIKFVGLWPDVLANPDQYSFVVLNVPADSTLALLDTDSDGMDDYDELYVYFTNPYDADTDDDGESDDDEATAGTDPNDFRDY